MGCSWEDKIVVIDNGSYLVKAINSSVCCNTVHSKVRTIIGTPKELNEDSNEILIGENALTHQSTHTLSNPMPNGIINDWDGMTALWDHIYAKDLQVDPSEKAVHLTVPPKNPNEKTQKMVELFFDHFKAPAVFVSCAPVLSLYSAGYTAGTVLDIGLFNTYAVPVENGHVLTQGIKKMNLGGKSLSKHLGDILCEAGINLNDEDASDIINDIKEKRCYVSQNFENEKWAIQKD